MTKPTATPRARLRAVAAATVCILGALAGATPAPASDPVEANFDARPEGGGATPAAVARAGDRLRERLGRFGALSRDDAIGTLRSVGRLDGFLTGPSGRDGADVALDYVRANATAFGLDGDDLEGLRVVDRSFAGGIEHVVWEQRYRGIPVADAGLKAAITGSGRLMNVTGPPASDLGVRSVEPSVRAADAYAIARESGGDARPDVDVDGRARGAEQVTRFSDGGRASLALYRAGSGYRLAWRVLAPVSSTGVYDVLVDARSGDVMRRANRVKFAVNAKVFRYNPAAGPQETHDFEPWLTSTTKLEGPNAYAFLDVHDVVGPQQSGAFQLTPEANSDVAPVSGGYDLTTVPSYGGDGCPDNPPSPPAPPFPTSACTWDPRPSGAGSWAVNKNQSATQLFYFVNTFHDHLRDDPGIAFNERGFRRTAKPLGDPNTAAAADASDPVLAQAMDGADTASGDANNANFLTLPDGYPGLMQMYLWEPPEFGGYDGANDAATVFHEYAHGLSGRLVTDSGGFEALSGRQSGALSEGWSDYYALDYLVAQGLQPDASSTADVRFGRYLDNGTEPFVRFQSIDCEPQAGTAPGCPEAPGLASGAGFTYEDFGVIGSSGPEVHDDGEIWAQTLWSLRDAVGVADARRLITTAMRLSPPEPSFLDMRNAILQASTEEDDAAVWTVFAERGMGYFASTEGDDDIAPSADFTDPADLTGQATLEGFVEDQDGVPVQSAEVAIGALGDEVVALTAANGSYTLDVLVPGGDSHTYPTLLARKAAYADDPAPGVLLTDGEIVEQDFVLERDWSSVYGGASVEGFTGSDNTNDGCGPGGLIDDDPGVVWGTENVPGGRKIVIDLGAPIDVSRVAIDPSAGCGDDASAALGGYELQGSAGPDDPPAALVTPGAFTPSQNGTLNTAFSGLAPRVRFLTLLARSPQDDSPGASGEHFIDVAELHVARAPHTAVGPATETGAAQSVGTSGATLTGSVTPNDGATEIFFQYGTSTAYGATAAAPSLPAGASAKPVSAAVGGLQPSTTYHFRVVAQRGGHLYPGGDATFTTAAAPPPPQPTPTVTPTPTPQPPSPRATVLTDTRLSASRTGMFKVNVFFGDAAPAGDARFTVLSRKGKRLARATTPVRVGRTVIKTLRLSKKGRRAIRRGKSKTVTLELRLPSGQKLKKTLRLSRKKR